MKCPNIQIIGVPEEEDKKKGHEKILEIIVENSPKMGKEVHHINKLKDKRIKRNEDNLRDLWDNVKRPNIRIIGVPEEEDKKKGHEKLLEEKIAENHP